MEEAKEMKSNSNSNPNLEDGLDEIERELEDLDGEFEAGFAEKFFTVTWRKTFYTMTSRVTGNYEPSWTWYACIIKLRLCKRFSCHLFWRVFSKTEEKSTENFSSASHRKVHFLFNLVDSVSGLISWCSKSKMYLRPYYNAR